VEINTDLFYHQLRFLDSHDNHKISSQKSRLEANDRSDGVEERLQRRCQGFARGEELRSSHSFFAQVTIRRSLGLLNFPTHCCFARLRDQVKAVSSDNLFRQSLLHQSSLHLPRQHLLPPILITSVLIQPGLHLNSSSCHHPSPWLKPHRGTVCFVGRTETPFEKSRNGILDSLIWTIHCYKLAYGTQNTSFLLVFEISGPTTPCSRISLVYERFSNILSTVK
jgi:hypothetical protein